MDICRNATNFYRRMGTAGSWYYKISELYDKATFHLNKDYTIQTCHNDMVDIERNSRMGPACKNLVKDETIIPLKNGKDVKVDVLEIKTLQSGACVGMFLFQAGC